VIDARERLGQSRKLRIWSAACSTGQEPYSIGIVLHELLRDLKGWDIQIIATDIARPRCRLPSAASTRPTTLREAPNQP
jgi:chemotaxis protein methyltransferase CheR